MDPNAPWRAFESEPAPTPDPQPDGRALPASVRRLALLAAGVVVIAASLAIVVGSQLGSGTTVEVARSTSTSSPIGSVASGGSARLVVEVAGAVAHPGVYALPEGARVADAIKAAGGYSPDVDARQTDAALNLAARIADGQLIRVPRRGDAIHGPTDGPSSGTAGGPIDLNSATAEQLDTLPGVGPATAAKIIAARAEQRFASVDDLVTRKLVTAATLAKFRDRVTVR